MLASAIFAGSPEDFRSNIFCFLFALLLLCASALAIRLSASVLGSFIAAVLVVVVVGGGGGGGGGRIRGILLYSIH